MSDRKPALIGGFLLALVVGAAGTAWALSDRVTADPVASAGILGDQGFPEAVDPAQDPLPLDHPGPIEMKVYMDPNCGCCGDWVDHIREYGFDVEVEYTSDMLGVKQAHSIRPDLSSCHTATVNGYVIEGHIPGDVVREFLAEAPQARGIAVPGMPIGSPGMEMGDRVDAYDVLAFTSEGRVAVYSRQGQD